LREFGETRRGWLGVRIQPVTPEIAESLSIKPARGALIAGLDDKGPAKPAGIEAGDVIVSFDGHDIKEMRDLPKIVADTPVGKSVEVKVVRDGKEITKTVTLARLEDGEKQAALTKKDDQPAGDKGVVHKTLGIEVANLSDELRRRYNIQSKVKGGVVITGVEPNSAAAEKRLTPGTIILSVQQQPVNSAADLHARVEKLKKEGKRAAVFLLSNASGDTTFVAINLQ
jgi:serine protease Do